MLMRHLHCHTRLIRLLAWCNHWHQTSRRRPPEVRRLTDVSEVAASAVRVGRVSPRSLSLSPLRSPQTQAVTPASVRNNRRSENMERDIKLDNGCSPGRTQSCTRTRTSQPRPSPVRLPLAPRFDARWAKEELMDDVNAPPKVMNRKSHARLAGGEHCAHRSTWNGRVAAADAASGALA